MSGVAGRSGRKRGPALLKVIHGTARADRINPNAPRPKRDLGLADAPAFLPAGAAEFWNQCIREAPRGLLKSTDSMVVAEYCIALFEYERITRMLTASGPMLRVGGELNEQTGQVEGGRAVVNPLLREQAR